MHGPRKRRKEKEVLQRSRTLVRLLPKLGYCSRTQAFALIRSGRVTVDGRSVTDPNKIVRKDAFLKVGGERVGKKKIRCLLFHKPPGVVTTRKDERGRRTVYDILGDVGDWVFPVGRLDKESEGLLIFTNDTAFGNALTEPRNKAERTYVVIIDGNLSPFDLKRVRKGIHIGRGEISKPISLRIIEQDLYSTTCEITLTEGRNREIRRLFKVLGKDVRRLIRIRFGNFTLGSLKPGEWREGKIR